MNQKINADGSITVGILSDVKAEPAEKAEKPKTQEKPAKKKSK